jgi:CBS domain-containing protein
VVTLPRDYPLTRVIDRMVETRWRSFPVVEGERLVGVVSRSDVLLALRRAASGQRAD